MSQTAKVQDNFSLALTFLMLKRRKKISKEIVKVSNSFIAGKWVKQLCDYLLDILPSAVINGRRKACAINSKKHLPKFHSTIKLIVCLQNDQPMAIKNAFQLLSCYSLKRHLNSKVAVLLCKTIISI